MSGHSKIRMTRGSHRGPQYFKVGQVLTVGDRAELSAGQDVTRTVANGLVAAGRAVWEIDDAPVAAIETQDPPPLKKRSKPSAAARGGTKSRKKR